MSEFHYLRPWWVLALLPCVVLIWHLYVINDPVRRWRQLISPELLPHLLVRSQELKGVSPLALLAVCWGGTVLALAGPTWKREPAPFGDDTAAVVIVLKVTPSMLTDDIQPTRLRRSIQKIHDLLALRSDAKTALVAYSGTAHQVLPLTTDAGVMDSFASELAPDVMPVEGDEAVAGLQLADQILKQSDSRGWILWIADGLNPTQLPALQKGMKAMLAPVTILAASANGPEHQKLLDAAKAIQTPVVDLTPDDQDVKRLATNARFSISTGGTGDRWRDSGYWLAPVLCVLCLGWFRRGWILGEAT